MKLCLYVCMYLYDHLCFLHRFGELFDRLLATDHVHNVVSVLCYLQSVTESLSTAVSTLSASLSSISTVILPLWTSIVAALQHHLNTVSHFLTCKFSRYCHGVCLYACLWQASIVIIWYTVSADLSLRLDSFISWAPWHQSMSTYSQSSFSSSTGKRSVVWINAK